MKKSRKGKGKEKAVNQDGELGGGDEEMEMGDLEEEGDELLDPSALVAGALGSAGEVGVGPEDAIGIADGIADGGRTAVR
jgi:hypothetical protein